MTKLKYLLPAVLVLILSGFVWLKEHDKVLVARTLARARADSMAVQDKRVDGLVEALKAMNSAYAIAEQAHRRSMETMRDSLSSLDSTIKFLADDVAAQLPDSSKPLVAALVNACRHQVDLVFSNLTTCESLKQNAEKNSAKKDSLILDLTRARNGYKHLYEESTQPVETTWSTVGKLETSAGLLAILTKLFGLW